MTSPRDRLHRGIGYVRVSTANQEAGVSLDAQEEFIRAYCKGIGLELIQVVREVYSGTKLARDKLDQEILPLVERGAITHIVCYDQDRWARNEYVRLKWEKEVLEPHGVELLVVNEGVFQNPYDRQLIRGVKGNVAQHFAEANRAKIIDAMHYKAARSEYCGGNVPYGFQLAQADTRTTRWGKMHAIRVYDPHPFERKVVLFIKELYGWGRSDLFPIPEEFRRADYGTTVITQILNSLKIHKRNGKPFDTAFVKKLIRDDFNYHVGTFSYLKTYGDKEERKRRKSTHRSQEEIIVNLGAFPAIVGPELQKLCKEKIGEKGMRAKRSRFTVATSAYLGSGLFSCAGCGSVLVGRTRAPDRKHKEAEQRYMCASRYNKTGCRAPMVKASYLHEGLDEVMKSFLSAQGGLEAIISHTRAIVQKQENDRPGTIASLQERLCAVTRQKQNLIANLKEAPGLGAILQEEVVSLDHEQRTLQEQLRTTEAGHLALKAEAIEKVIREACQGMMRIWQDAPIVPKNRLLKQLITRAEVHCETKEVKYSLAIPLDSLLKSGTIDSTAGKSGGCTEVLAEVHGNRTHLPDFGRYSGFEDHRVLPS